MMSIKCGIRFFCSAAQHNMVVPKTEHPLYSTKL